MLTFILTQYCSSVRVWDVHTGKLRHTLTGHTEEIEVSYNNDEYYYT